MTQGALSLRRGSRRTRRARPHFRSGTEGSPCPSPCMPVSRTTVLPSSPGATRRSCGGRPRSPRRDGMAQRRLGVPMSVVTVVQHSLLEAHAFVRPLLKDLTEDEYFWEPAARCWSVRRNREPFPPELPGLLGGESVPNTRPWRVEHGWEWTDGN